jgi:methylenetetrahydrofolate reductase (NADPH)
MVLANQSASPAAASADELKQRIVRFMCAASTEITPNEEKRLPELAMNLPAGTAIYVAHTPAARVSDVVRTAIAVQRAGFVATPHIVARRIPNALTLRKSLIELHASGIAQILLIAGDASAPMGEFTSALDVLNSGALEQVGIERIGVAAHPEGHKAIGPILLWEALEAKQAYAERTGVSMHIVTQFGFNASAVRDWENQLYRHQIRLPVHVGIAGPAPLSKLIHYAMQCGIGASLRTVMRNLSAVGNVAELAIRPEEHLIRLLSTTLPSQVVAPHIFAFGGCVATAEWIHRVAAGEIEIDPTSGKLSVRN